MQSSTILLWFLAFPVKLVLGTLSCPPTRSKTCVIPSKYLSSNGTADDSPAVAAALSKCSSDSVIIFSEGTNYNLLKPISATNLSNVEIQMLGNLHLPQNVT